MSSVTWIITNTPQISGLLDLARSAGAPVESVVIGSRETAEAVAAAGIDSVQLIELPVDTPAESAAASIARLARDQAPRLVLAASSHTGKILAGAAAAALDAELLTAVTSVSGDDAGVTTVRGLFGGIAEATETWTTPVAIVTDPGRVPEPGDAAANVEYVSAEPYPVTVTARTTVQSERVDLGAAKRVVAIGRGLKQQVDVALVEELAAALGAEVACSRPLAEGLDWFGKDRYVGVSGAHLAPELYVAVGISGQLQHMSGVRDAETIVAVNSDKNAPVFALSDYGVVGDLYKVLPALTTALRGL